MFDGNEVDLTGFVEKELNILPGASKQMMFCGTLKDVSVIVKLCADPRTQLCIDELKPLFGLEKMDAGHGMYKDKKVVVLKYHEHVGRLADVKFYPDWLLSDLVKVLSFIALVKTGDPTSRNVLVLTKRRLLMIDEGTGFKFKRPWIFHAQRQVRKSLMDVVGSELRKVLEKWPSDDKIVGVLSRFFSGEQLTELVKNMTERKTFVTNEVFEEVYRW